MVEIFKTNITENSKADRIITRLQSILPGAKINFDLEDRDRILRVEWMMVPVPLVAQTVSDMGFECQVLE